MSLFLTPNAREAINAILSEAEQEVGITATEIEPLFGTPTHSMLQKEEPSDKVDKQLEFQALESQIHSELSRSNYVSPPRSPRHILFSLKDSKFTLEQSSFTSDDEKEIHLEASTLNKPTPETLSRLKKAQEENRRLKSQMKLLKTESEENKAKLEQLIEDLRRSETIRKSMNEQLQAETLIPPKKLMENASRHVQRSKFFEEFCLK